MSIKPLSIIAAFLFVSNIYSLRSNPIYVTQSENYHIVEQGETLYGISKRYSISVAQLKLFNNLEDDKIIVGQKIYLTPAVAAKAEYVTKRPIPKEGYHLVLKGETVYRISKIYELEIMDIVGYNNLESFDIKAGQKIWLVPDKVDTATDSVKTTVTPTDDTKPIAKYEESASYHIVSSGENLYRISLKYGMTVAQLKELNSLVSDKIHVGQKLAVSPTKKAAGTLKPATKPTKTTEVAKTHKKGSIRLPVKGKAVSEFGIRNKVPHNGIDIAAPIGEPIYAALDGKVVFVGVQRGYGNVVVLEHDNYIMTVYAHNERNLVRLGDSVKRGQPIATVGQTGNASGPHLHFEYRIRGKAIDPREVLPDF